MISEFSHKMSTNLSKEQFLENKKKVTIFFPQSNQIQSMLDLIFSILPSNANTFAIYQTKKTNYELKQILEESIDPEIVFL